MQFEVFANIIIDFVAVIIIVVAIVAAAVRSSIR